MKLTLGISPCPNDTFIFDALVNGLVEAEGLTFDVLHEDVQTLNEWALEGRLDVTKLTTLDLTTAAESLAKQYLDAGISPRAMPDDALHVAIAVLTRQDVLVSWNFKHLVNRRRRAAVDSFNLSLRLPTIAILPPPEV